MSHVGTEWNYTHRDILKKLEQRNSTDEILEIVAEVWLKLGMLQMINQLLTC